MTVWKPYDKIKGLCELDMPSEKQLNSPTKLCIEQGMHGQWVGVVWTHYADGGIPQFLEYGHNGRVRSRYTIGLSEARRWIARSDKWINEHLDDYPDRKEKWWDEKKETGVEVYDGQEAMDKMRELGFPIPAGVDDRYVFDFEVCNGKGWMQYDTEQDASYYGCWINRDRFLTFNYVEGDLILTVSATKDMFKRELQEMNEFHGSPPPFAVAGDGIGLDGKLENPQAFYDTESRSLDF